MCGHRLPTHGACGRRAAQRCVPTTELGTADHAPSHAPIYQYLIFMHRLSLAYSKILSVRFVFYIVLLYLLILRVLCVLKVFVCLHFHYGMHFHRHN